MLYCSLGQTSVTINFDYGGFFGKNWSPPLLWFLILWIDGNCVNVLDNPPYTLPYHACHGTYTATLGVGTHTAEVMLFDSRSGTVADAQITYTVIAVTHGTKTAKAELYVQGYWHAFETSDYITPGSNVAWHLSLRTFNMPPGTTSASAQISGVLSKSISVATMEIIRRLIKMTEVRTIGQTSTAAICI